MACYEGQRREVMKGSGLMLNGRREGRKGRVDWQVIGRGEVAAHLGMHNPANPGNIPGSRSGLDEAAGLSLRLDGAC